MNNAKNIVFITDESYVTATAVAIRSLISSNVNLSKYNVNIITVDISASSEDILKSLSTESLSISLIKKQKDNLKKFNIENLHVTPAATLKFELPNIFNDLDKILYLDCDILIRNDISSLFDLDLNERYAAVVKDYKPMSYNPPQPKKLGIDHKAYFNSGVMMLNLKKMREDSIPEKLYKYRENGINFFMDQDALNVVFKENVIYLDICWNAIISTIGAFSAKDLATYYCLNDVNTKQDILDRAKIIHLTTKFKPWTFVNVPYHNEWMSQYKSLPIKPKVRPSILDIDVRKKVMSGIRVRISLREFGIKDKVFVNITSFPGRINEIYKVIRSIQKQTVRVDKIKLWLSVKQFPQKELNLNEHLLKLVGRDFEIKWVEEDLKPHKKYYYAIKEYSNSINITLDDDIAYESDTIERLLITYIKYPYAISANRAHLMVTDADGKLLTYDNWEREVFNNGLPSILLMPTGVGGVLYPPNIFNNEILLDIAGIEKNCLFADDIWLKLNSLINNVPVAVSQRKFKLNFIEGSQEFALWKTNDKKNENDRQMTLTLNYLESKGYFLRDKIRLASKADRIYVDSPNGKKNIEIGDYIKVKRKLEFLRNSVSFKIGRFITFVPRKIIQYIRQK